MIKIMFKRLFFFLYHAPCYRVHHRIAPKATPPKPVHYTHAPYYDLRLGVPFETVFSGYTHHHDASQQMTEIVFTFTSMDFFSLSLSGLIYV